MIDDEAKKTGRAIIVAGARLTRDHTVAAISGTTEEAGKLANPPRYFHSSPEVMRLVVLMYVRFPLSLRNVEDLLFERGIDLCHETVRLWWNRFGPMFAADIRRQRVDRMRGFRHWRWHVDEMYVRINGEMHYLWRAVDHEGELLESYVTKTRDTPLASPRASRRQRSSLRLRA